MVLRNIECSQETSSLKFILENLEYENLKRTSLQAFSYKFSIFLKAAIFLEE